MNEVLTSKTHLYKHIFEILQNDEDSKVAKALSRDNSNTSQYVVKFFKNINTDCLGIYRSIANVIVGIQFDKKGNDWQI